MTDKVRKCDSPEEWELEQRAFAGANCSSLPDEIRRLISDLWKEVCAREALASLPAPLSEREIREALASVADYGWSGDALAVGIEAGTRAILTRLGQQG